MSRAKRNLPRDYYYSAGPEESEWPGPPEAARLAPINEGLEDFLARVKSNPQGADTLAEREAPSDEGA